MNDFTKEEMMILRSGRTTEFIERKRDHFINAIKEGKVEYAFIDSCRIVDGKNVCPCGGAPFFNGNRSKHTKTKRHIKYMEQNLKIQEIQETPLLLPTTTPEIQEIPIPDVIPEPIQEITASIPDTSPTKLEIAKKKKQEYMREYMRKYHAKRYNEDEEYRKYRIEMTNKSSCVMRTRYIKAYQYIKENKIAIFDEKGN
jgi:hypothetical protein